MYNEDDFLMLSALQHFIFCPRQCALIHIEQAWVENRFTAEGRAMHENVHEQGSEKIKDVRVERGMPLRSFELGLIGKADVVEFHKMVGGWVPFPVEYKHGKPKPDDCDKVQLCAQAMCLEEMHGVKIEKGAIFYGKPKHRLAVEFDAQLRSVTLETAISLHELINSGKTPAPAYSKMCESCSLKEICMPEATSSVTSVAEYLKSQISDLK